MSLCLFLSTYSFPLACLSFSLSCFISLTLCLSFYILLLPSVYLHHGSICCYISAHISLSLSLSFRFYRSSLCLSTVRSICLFLFSTAITTCSISFIDLLMPPFFFLYIFVCFYSLLFLSLLFHSSAKNNPINLPPKPFLKSYIYPRRKLQNSTGAVIRFH